MTHHRIPFMAVLLLFGFLTTSSATASTHFPERITLENQALQRIGLGTARYAGIIRVYDAALYAPATGARADILDTALPKRLEILYHRSIEAKLLVEAALRTLEHQHGSEILVRWQSHLDRLHAAYRDVSAGDRFALEMIPEQGLRLEFNGREVARIYAPAFGRLYFGIWLGEKPLSATLRDALLPVDCCRAE